MAAQNSITNEIPEKIFASLDQIILAKDSGSVITRDNTVAILIKLAGLKKYDETVFPLLNEQILTAPASQVSMYAENALPALTEKFKEQFKNCLKSKIG